MPALRMAYRVAVTLLPMAPLAVTAQVNRFTSVERSALADLGPSEAMEFALHDAWYRGRPVRYFDFGPMSATTSAVILPVYGLDSAGRPLMIPGQRPIFTALPGLPGYTGYAQVQYLIVPRTVASNAITDGRQATSAVLTGQARFIYPRLIANLPVVPRGSFLVGDPVRRPLSYGWFRGIEVPYFDFGLMSTAPVPLYTFVAGKNADGGPTFLRAQHNILDVVPGEGKPSSDVWDIQWVHVDSLYEPNRWRSLAELLASGQIAGYRIISANMLRNCPVVLLDGKPVERPQSPFANPALP